MLEYILKCMNECHLGHIATPVVMLHIYIMESYYSGSL